MTSTVDRLDPELAAVLAGIGPRDFAGLGIGGVRENARVKRAAARATRLANPRVAMSDVTDGPVLLREYRLADDDRSALRPAVLWFHGGGYVLGGYEDNADLLEGFVVDTGCVAYSVEYRLAPEHPFPAALDDAIAAIDYVTFNSAQLGVDMSRIALAGGSAGGGLAACAALRCRDRGGPRIGLQVLMYPLLDDRAITPSTQLDTVVWTKEENLIALRAYLGGAYPDVDVAPYAIAARADDLTGSPRTAIVVGELDLFRDDAIAYAGRLYAADVSVELVIFPGAPHGLDSVAPTAAITERFVAAVRSAFAAGIGAL